MTSNFSFLQQEWPDIFSAARKCEKYALQDPVSSCFYARRALELVIRWAFTHDANLCLPYQDNLSALMHEPSFVIQAGEVRLTKARVIRDLGNIAAHSNKPIRREDAVIAVRELFHFTFWFARTYARTDRPADALAFNAELLPATAPLPAHTRKQLQELEAELHARDEKLSDLLNSKVALDEEIKRLRAEVAAAKAANNATPDTHNYSEAETRDYFIDLLLKEAGWALDQPRDREYEAAGMPNTQEKGFVDYVLWGDDGKPLALVEAKRTRRDARIGQQQASLYADCLEKQFGQRPIIFYTNGYEHWLWDDAQYPPRSVQGFYKKDELGLLIQRRTMRRSLAEAPIKDEIINRYYQTRAIRRIGESFEKDHTRKSLLVMATGSGKTRTVIALCDMLMRSNWVKRVLFLADRTALVNQAVNAFKAHLPDSSPVNLVTERNQEGRVFVSTYQTMMNLIDDTASGQRRFGVGHFDLVIIDEAHRSIFRKYKAIFDYFDSLLVGLTATPRSEIDRNTYSIFDLENGVPTDSYELEDAVKDGFLVPSKAVAIPLRFPQQGIRYAELSDEEKEEWDSLDWDDDGGVPDTVDGPAVNNWLFNTDTVDKVLEHLMTKGQHVASGDRLGKTIIFAKNHNHAQFIAERFDINYPHYRGEFARVVDFQTVYVQNLIDKFSQKDKLPHIAISVDMLDTGIDIPEIVNLVFFKVVRSKTKFWQMVGRGTRLRPDLFSPGMDKEFFYIFDWCQNLQYFGDDPPTTSGSSTDSLEARIFRRRVELVAALDHANGQHPVSGVKVDEPDTPNSYGLRGDVAGILRAEVAAMPLHNFVVRPKRKLVEVYSKADAWEKKLGIEQVTELTKDIAGLPTQLPPDDEDAKHFDLLILNIQLGVLEGLPPQRAIEKVQTIAGLLEEKSNIPAINQHLALIQEIQTPEYWTDVTPQMLEHVRRSLRMLIKLIEKKQRKIVYTDFEDQMGEEEEISLPGFAAPDSYAKFKAKARHFLMEHSNEGAIAKLRNNEPLTPADIKELENILIAEGIGGAEQIAKAKEESKGLGYFVRSLVGMNREAAKTAFAGFIAKKNLRPNQIEFVDLIINHLTENGVVDTAMLYDSPYTDLNPLGLDGLFNETEITELLSVITTVHARAGVAA